MATAFLVIIYASFISLGLPDSLLGVAWPAMQLEYNVPYGFAGFVSMVISGGTIVSSLFSGRVLKRFGTGMVTFVSVAMTAGALLGFSLAPSFVWLLLLAIPLGLGAGSVDSGLNDYIARHYKAHHMNWLHCFWGIGAMSGPIIISQVIGQNGSWRNGYLTVSIIQFVLVIALFFSLPVWDKVAKLSRGSQPASDEAIPEPPSQPKNVFYPLQLPGVRFVLLAFLFYCGVEATIGLWGASYLVKEKGLEIATAAQWVSLFFGSITVGRLIAGFITMRVSNTVIIRTGEIIILLGTIVLLLPLPSTFSLIGYILIGFGCAPIFPGMLHETPARFGEEDAPSVMGFQMAVAYTGTTLLPPIFGFIATNTTLALMPFVLFAYILIILISSERVNLFMRRKQTVAY
jgi:fucose permease